MGISNVLKTEKKKKKKKKKINHSSSAVDREFISLY